MSSARIRPNSDAYLKAWAAPSATSTLGASGTRSRTKSRSGVSVYRQVFVTMSGPTAPGRCAARNASDPGVGSGSTSNVRSAGVVSRPADVLGRLRPGLAVGREAVEARLVHPDPDREPIRREVLGSRAGVVGHLLLGDRQRQAPARTTRAARSSRRRRPARRGRRDGSSQSAVTTSSSPPPGVAQRRHRRPVEQRRPVARAQPLVRGVRPVRVGQPAVRPGTARGARRRQPPLRPATHDLVRRRGARTARPRRSCSRCSPTAGSPRRAARRRAHRSA